MLKSIEESLGLEPTYLVLLSVDLISLLHEGNFLSATVLQLWIAVFELVAHVVSAIRDRLPRPASKLWFLVETQSVVGRVVLPVGRIVAEELFRGIDLLPAPFLDIA